MHDRSTRTNNAWQNVQGALKSRRVPQRCYGFQISFIGFISRRLKVAMFRKKFKNLRRRTYTASQQPKDSKTHCIQQPPRSIRKKDTDKIHKIPTLLHTARESLAGMDITRGHHTWTSHVVITRGHHTWSHVSSVLSST
ncbi:hypothetical protein DPEC_G00234500 [Dallia pectoralis]|uniref:Uncharacterized protein n=1 Tax=Dallia pectoralis TaxID=75939 RepID=A0ACC2FXV9_DALPE|nr:hypothetical protein DPEC_G00234500 [Dallia pectoralis]